MSARTRSARAAVTRADSLKAVSDLERYRPLAETNIVSSRCPCRRRPRRPRPGRAPGLVRPHHRPGRRRPSKTAVHVDHFVRAGQQQLSIVAMNDVWVVANLKETDVGDVDAATPSRSAWTPIYPDRRFSGHVESISAATGATFLLLPPDNATGDFIRVVQCIPARICLDRPQDPDAVLRPGMTVEVTIEVR